MSGTPPADDTPACCACCCCACCKPDSNPVPEHLRDGDVFSGRSCTDFFMIILYALFVAGWVIIIGVATSNGKPERILRPSNYRGDICGEDRLASMNTLWVPLPSRPAYGYCVPGCPAVGTIVCNNDWEVKLGTSSTLVANSFYTHTSTEFTDGAVAAAQCKVSSCSAAQRDVADRYVGLQIKMSEKKCFFSFYPSKPSLLRCIPSLQSDTATPANITMQNLANESATGVGYLKDTLGASSFFTLGFAEIMQSWRVILIAAFTCMALAALWVMLLRWVLKPVVYLVVVLILGIFIALGFVFKFFADDLARGALPGERGVENQETIWRAAEYTCFLLAAMYFVIMLYMLKRIRIAIAVMEEASRAFAASPSMIIIPILTFVLLIGWIAFFIVTTIYIQTMGTIDSSEIRTTVVSFFGSSAGNLTDLLLGSTLNASGQLRLNGTSPIINVSSFSVADRTKILHAYNFFAVLWTGNFCIMLGFFMIAMSVCAWYFSATQDQMRLHEEDASNEAGKEKQTPPGVIVKSFVATFCNHLGTVLWGALLIAIMQFIRAVFTYISENYLKEFDNSTAGAIVLKCVQCCLWYVEHVVRVVSQNAFIVCVIRSSNFCSSAAEALSLIMTNAARISMLSMLSLATLFLIKVFIVGGNIFIAYGLMQTRSLTENRPMESGLFPIFLIGVMSFAIATLFLNVYESCIDTIFICFLMDEQYFKGTFMPKSLANIVDMFKGAEEARLEYEKKLNKAMNTAEPVKV